ncbi:hypothetical protein NDU88_007082 [Pleurodeles waltl]|uniref:Uncharacterized protein n=1 Tax=Pleurodeles waltl TaxID=8319 RepID=A0AAV7MF26_PLEWA|nr:hypothetical protein NDU88_007082 [Pleurodeles waltl]
MVACLLGDFPRPDKSKVGTRFLDLALALVKRKITMTWKSSTGIKVETWAKEVTDWARVEERILRQEDVQGTRCQLIAELRQEVLNGLKIPSTPGLRGEWDNTSLESAADESDQGGT